MGSSTRNSYDRSKKAIGNGIASGSIGSSGQGIGSLLSNLVFPKNGLSKIRKTLQENLYSPVLTSSIKKIVNISNAIKTGKTSGLGIGGFGSLTGQALKNAFVEYVGIEEEEFLKTSFLETLEEVDLLDKETNIVDFLSTFLQNIISNIYKQYTYEDTLDSLPNFDEKIYQNSLKDYLYKNAYPKIKINLSTLDLSNIDSRNFGNKVNSVMTNIMNSLRNVGG